MQIGSLVHLTALQNRLDPLLVAAVVQQESGGDPYAIRYEPNFFRKYVENVKPKDLQGYVPERCSLLTERMARSTSWGLMQIMGQTARERGFAREFLSELLVPEENLAFGCRILASFIQEKGSTEAGLLRYNGGGNEKYPSEVLARIESGSCHSVLLS